MQIRLTVALESRGGGQGSGHTGTSSCEVLVTAPAGTVLAAVTGALASTAAASTGGGESSAGDSVQDPVTVYAGRERLDPHRQMIGDPPLLDGAVVSLHSPASATAVPAYGSAKARLHVTAGPDAGGIHLLQGGNVRLGRSAEADVPLDDPDVSRMHCTVSVTDGGDVTVTDLGSTNGTWLDGAPLGGQPALFRPGATLALGESAVRLEAAAPAGEPPTVPALPDGNGRLRLAPSADDADAGTATAPSAAPPQSPQTLPNSRAYPSVSPPPQLPLPKEDGTHGAGLAGIGPRSAGPPATAEPGGLGAAGGAADPEHRRARGLGAWARRFAGGRSEEAAGTAVPSGPTPGTGGIPGVGTGPSGTGPEAGSRESDGSTGGPRQQRVPGSASREGDTPLPDPATVLLTALGPGPRLWEREPGHPHALTVRLGTAHGSTGRPGEPVTVDLRSAGALGLAGPRTRLAGLARSVLAQLTAMHGPSTLEVVLLATDRGSTPEVRSTEWAWLGRLPHLRPAHGQDCRLLTAYDHDQAAARTAELTRRLDEEQWVSGGEPGRGHGPYTVLVVDGDPGTPALRDTVARLATEGPTAGIHVLALAEAPSATPASPLAATAETACDSSPAFRQCGTLALLSGAVATAVRVVRRDSASSTAAATAAGGAVATVDAVSAAWAERFARALAPLREAEGTAARTGTTAQPVVTLPRSARLLDELGLARATPAALLARWSEPDSAEAGRARLVFGAGPRGPVETELTAAQRHALITGPVGTGKTELLRSLAASLAAGERPDRLQLLLLDGDGDPAHDGLRVCAELPHVKSHLAAGDPVRMREFAQSLTYELKRRAELLGDHGTYEEYARSGGGPAPRVVMPRSSPEMTAQSGQGPDTAGAGDLTSDPTRGTLRLRPRAQRHGAAAEQDGPGADSVPASDGRLPRVVLLVDDLDTLVEPALGNPGRPAAGSVIRALESVAREGARLGVHLVSATGRPERMAGTAAAHIATAELRAELTATAPEGKAGEEETVPGRGVLSTAGGATTAFQSGRVTGRIPRTATQRPTVVPLDWTRAGDPPARRPVRELGNGPTDLALLASATVRAAQSLGTAPAAAGAGRAARSRSGQEGALDS